MSEGETRTFTLTFPADYHGKEVAGKQAEFVLTVKRVEGGIVPRSTPSSRMPFGIASGSVDELKAEIAANLTLELKRKIETKVKDQVVWRAAAAGTVRAAESPRRSRSAEHGATDGGRHAREGHEGRGHRVAPEALRPAAETRVALGLILSEIVRSEGPGCQARANQGRWCRRPRPDLRARGRLSCAGITRKPSGSPNSRALAV
jgi:trigger factor